MKQKTQYVCQNCGVSTAKWLGRCNGCGEWNTLVEEVDAIPEKLKSRSALATLREDFQENKPKWVSLIESFGENPSSGNGKDHRYGTGLKELDRVLGGGLVRDSFTLLGGEPGIGKSTLLLQVADRLGSQGIPLLYVSGEESIEQISQRAKRLGIKSESIYLASETVFEKVLADVKELKPKVLIMDSIQTFSTLDLESAPGSVGQVREVAARLMTLAKSAGIAVWLVGHVTKDGAIAGPKVVEHMVDTVLYFESDPGQNFRLLRTIKNRFGSTRELGAFEMGELGLREVDNPSELFLTDRKEKVAGIAVAATLEGTRSLLVEVQALVSPSPLPMPRRMAVGLDHNRLGILAAIIERHMRLPLVQKDLFFNVSGGLRLTEPASDLAAVAAIWSSAEDVALSSHWVWMGEVALTGEVRKVSQMESRIEEANKLGFKVAVVPKGTQQKITIPKGFEIREIQNLSELPRLI